MDTFSKRQKRLKGEVSDVFTYDEIPEALRVQICHIWMDCLGAPKISYMGENPAYSYLHRTIAAEFGLFALRNISQGHRDAIMDFFVQDATTEQALDMIEIIFRHVLYQANNSQWKGTFRVAITATQAIEDLNIRFLEHGIGYAFLEGETPQLIRKDNEHLHQETIMPALRLLHEEGFEGVNDEYRTAHDHYRRGNYKECLTECAKAFESAMKTI